MLDLGVLGVHENSKRLLLSGCSVHLLLIGRLTTTMSKQKDDRGLKSAMGVFCSAPYSCWATAVGRLRFCGLIAADGMSQRLR